MQEDFAIVGTPTGFNDANVTLTGYFEYDWDPEREKLLDKQVVILGLDRSDFTDTTGVTYKFTSQAIDRSRIKQFEGNWPEGHGFRDTLHLIANIISTYSAPGEGTRHDILATAEIMRMGNRYYEKVR
ncbi:MAG: hypothetical protein ACJ8M1_15455 [Chthoniobacterales bacterium]